MTLQEIKAAVDAGKKVHWASDIYEVRKVDFRNGTHDYFILCVPNGNSIGLTWRDEVTMNGKPEEFYIATS